jgi:hypothetical protein
MAKPVGTLSFAVYLDDAGNIEIRPHRELEPEIEVLAALLTPYEQEVVKDATNNAAKLAGKVLRYIARPDKRVIANKGFGSTTL